MSTELLEKARRLQQIGDHARAEQTCRQLVQQDPGNAPAWHLLGTVCQAQGKLADAIDHYHHCLRLQPDFAQVHHDLGLAEFHRGHPEEAEKYLRRVVALRPTSAPAHHNLGNILVQQGKLQDALSQHQEAARLNPNSPDILRHLGRLQRTLGQLDEAASTYRRAIQLQPTFAEAHLGLASVLADQGRYPQAEVSCRLAIQYKPDFAEAFNTLGAIFAAEGKTQEAVANYGQALHLQRNFPEALNNLGLAVAGMGKLDEAIGCYQEALRQRPDFAEAHTNLGVALRDRRRPVDAEAACRVAVRLRPESAEVHNNLGLTLFDQERMEEALDCFQRAVQLKPQFAPAHNNVGSALWRLGRFEEAQASYASALRIKPDYPEPHRNLAQIWLTLGDYEKGLAEYEWEWRRPESQLRPFTQPRWDGSPLAGRTILLYAEQGLGDTLQYVRYARLAKDQGATVIVECQPPLKAILANCPGIDQLVAHGEPLPPFDVRAPLLGLPYLFRTKVDTIPATMPYLTADPALVEQWRQELAALSGFKIGIAWQGSPRYPGDTLRSLPLKEFAPLAEVPGVRLVSLQKGLGSDQVSAFADQWTLTDLSGRLDETTGAFMDTAAVMKNLDLVVSVDTAVAHLAGALGVPLWVALPTVPHWPWLVGRDDSPWYPSARLFRQERRGEWGPVFQRMAQAVPQRTRS